MIYIVITGRKFFEGQSVSAHVRWEDARDSALKLLPGKWRPTTDPNRWTSGDHFVKVTSAVFDGPIHKEEWMRISENLEIKGFCEGIKYHGQKYFPGPVAKRILWELYKAAISGEGGLKMTEIMWRVRGNFLSKEKYPSMSNWFPRNDPAWVLRPQRSGKLYYFPFKNEVIAS